MAKYNTRSNQAKSLSGLARGVRAAIVVPSLVVLGLLIIKQPQMAGFSVFGTFAHLVMINYSQLRATRAVQAVTLTLLGVVLICLGTFASGNPWTAVAGAITIGFLSEWPAVVRGHIAVVRTPLLLSFMLAVTVPTPLHFVAPQLSGWLLAGMVAQPLLQVLWIPIRHASGADEVTPARSSAVGSSHWLGSAVCTGLAMGLAVVTAHVLRLNHPFWVVLGVLPVLNARETVPGRIFWHEQAGTILGFIVGAFLVTIVGNHQEVYWIALPCVIFFSAYASTAYGFVAGQAAFTVFAVVLFCILSPAQGQVGILRVEDIAIGGVLSLLVASLQHLGQKIFTTKTGSGLSK